MARGRAWGLETLDATGGEREGTVNSLGGLVEGPQGQTHHKKECRVQDTRTGIQATIHHGRLPYTMARGRAWRLETLLYKPRVLQLVCRSYHRSTFARVFDTAVDLLGKRFLSIYSSFTSLFMQRTIRHPHESTFYTVPAMGHSRRGV